MASLISLVVNGQHLRPQREGGKQELGLLGAPKAYRSKAQQDGMKTITQTQDMSKFQFPFSTFLALGISWAKLASSMGASRSANRRSRDCLVVGLRSGSGWHVGCSSAPTLGNALEEAISEWQQTYEHPRLIHTSKAAQASLPKDQSIPSCQMIPEPVVTEGNNVAFGLVFLPCKWASRMKDLLAEIQETVGWPDRAPLLGVPTQGERLCFTSAEQDPTKPAAQAVLLDEGSLETISHESIRIQDTIDANPILSIQAGACNIWIYSSPSRGP